MIPVTYPSSVSTSKESQMVVFALSSVAGLQRWTDYIPVKYQSTGSDVPNSFNTNGYIACDFITNLTGKQAWVDYVPVFVDNLATTAWQVSDTGFIPFNTLAGGGTYVSLDLNFINATALDSRITFSRGTNATLTGSNGLIQYAPHNLLTNSEDFEAAVWDVSSPARVTITANQTLAPDGASTADLMTETTVTSTHRVFYNNVLGSNVQLVNTVSCFYKQNTGNAFALLAITDSGGGNQVRAWFNLQTGAVGTTQNLGLGSGVTATIMPANNGFWRCSVSGIAGGTGTCYVFIGMADADNSPSYTGSTGRSVFIWGAQLNVGALQSYNPTTPKNLLGFTQEPENAAWTKSNSYVQQNLLTWSQDFDNLAWGKFSGATVTANTAAAPDGTTTADTLNTSAAGAYVGQVLTVNGAHVVSVYLKRLDNDWVIVGNGNSVDRIAWFNLSSGVVGTQQNSTGTIQSVGNGWYRCSVIHTAVNTASSTLYVVSVAADNSGVRQGSVYAWGAQLVQGSTAGDYTQTTSAAAPTRYTNWDGTLTGRKLVEDTVNTAHYVTQSVATTAVTHAYNVYLKAGERSFALLWSPTANFGRVFNLASGTVSGTVAGVTQATADIASVGGGWYRCTIYGVCAAGSNAVRVYTMTDATTFSYTGDGTSGIYVSDFQLSNSASVDPYVYNPQAAAASAAYYGPRFDYDPVTLAPRGLLIEEQRTNLMLQSEAFIGSGWFLNNATLQSNVSIAPSGELTAEKIIADTTNTDLHRAGLIVSVTSGTTYTFSVYAKASEYSAIRVRNASQSFGAYFNIATGAVGNLEGIGTTASITPVGNNWYRCVFTYTASATGSATHVIQPIAVLNQPTYTGDGTSGIFIWGAQLEAGSFATSYIPTVASQVTRNADSASMLGDNFYTWYNASESTIYVEYSRPFLDTTRPSHYVNINDNTTNNSIVTYSSTLNATQGDTSVSGVSQGISSTGVALAANTTMKHAYAVKANSLILAVNGDLSTEDTSASLPVVSQMNIGNRPAGDRNANSWIRRINYYNTRLPNATLQALTT